MRWLARITALLITTTTIAVLLPASPIGATQSFDWSAGELVFGEKEPVNYTDSQCKNQYLVHIGGPNSSKKSTVCTFDHGSWRYGVYTEKSGQVYAPRWHNYFVVGLGTGTDMYKVLNMPSDSLIDLPNSQDIIHDYAVGMFTNNRRMRIMKNFPSQLVPNIGVDETTYMVNDETWEPVLSDRNSNLVTTKASGISESGRWLALEDGNLGLILKDLVTGELRLFSDYQHRYGVGSDASMNFIVSDNGSHIAMFDYNTTPTIYSITGNCGVVASDYSGLVSQYARDSFNACPSDGGKLLEALQSRYGMSAYRGVGAYAIEPSGGALYFLNCSWSEEDFQGSCSRLPLYANGYVPTRKITYLALGDSYSSGEGDIGKKEDGSSYYLPGTEQAKGCHLSTRSYPFLLRNMWNIDSKDMKSVACSGAKVVPDYIGTDEYLGQQGQLAGKDVAIKKETHDLALENFAAGTVRQIEFVAKYKPEKVTFTGGGNDIGFADILEYCTGSYRLFGVIPTAERCGYANDPQLRASLNRDIDEQYDSISLFVDKLIEASPETKIYIVGYPQFVSGPSRLCGRFIAILDREERIMIRESVTRLNNILKKVARDSGVDYVDIENSLDGGQICQDSKYMTGPLKLGMSKLMDENVQEAYHPNSSGHEKIAEVIQARFENGLEYDIENIPSEVNGLQVVKRTVLSGFLNIKQSHAIKLLTGILKPTSLVKIEMHSKPTALGTTTTQSDGSLETSIVIPEDVGFGKHLVTLTGIDNDSEPVQIQQFVYVTSGIPDDIDGDGIPDEDDQCNFITEWYVGDKNLCSIQDRLVYSPSPTDKKSKGQQLQRLSNQRDKLINSNDKITGGDKSVETVGELSTEKPNSAVQNNKRFQGDEKNDLDWTIAGIVIICLSGLGVLIYVIKKR